MIMFKMFNAVCTLPFCTPINEDIKNNVWIKQKRKRYE
jgi:hypothetical protein